MTDALVQQLALRGVPPYDGVGTRTIKRHRAEIRAFFGFRETSMDDGEALSAWFRDHAISQLRDIAQLTTVLESECRRRQLEPPAPDRIERIVRSAVAMYEERFQARTLDRLAPLVRARLDALLLPAEGDGDGGDEKALPRTIISTLRSDPGRVGVNSMRGELEKLAIIRDIELPADLFADAFAHDLESFRQRVAVETPWELRRHPEAARLTWLAPFVHLRGRATPTRSPTCSWTPFTVLTPKQNGASTRSCSTTFGVSAERPICCFRLPMPKLRSCQRAERSA